MIPQYKLAYCLPNPYSGSALVPENIVRMLIDKVSIKENIRNSISYKVRHQIVSSE